VKQDRGLLAIVDDTHTNARSNEQGTINLRLPAVDELTTLHKLQFVLTGQHEGTVHVPTTSNM
jgi:hypothetical protein